MSRLPDAVRNGLPADLKHARIAGVETADVDENVRLWGPPGTGKSTQSALRTATRAEESDLFPSQVTVVTYRKSLASTVRNRLIDWGVFEPDRDFEYWTTIHAAASRTTDFHARFSPPDQRAELEGMVGRKAEFRFCKKLGLQHSPTNPWDRTRWTVFADLYRYAKNNLLDVGEYNHVPTDALRSLESDLVGQRKLEAFYDEWGPAAKFEDVAATWEDFKSHHNAADFYEMLEAALDGRLPPMKHVVIDEYHDATPLMAAVTERWVRNADTAIVAGDPDQVVNGYDGADPGFFEELGERTGVDIPVVKLSRSWRCPDEHFAAASRVLSTERQAPALDTAGPGKLHRWPSGEFELDDSGTWSYPTQYEEGAPAWLWEEFGDDIMYLSRTRKQANGVAAALDAAGIVYDSQPRIGGDWSKRLRLLNLLVRLERIEPPAASTPKHVDRLAEQESNLGNHSLRATEARLLFEHTHGHYIEDESGLSAFLSGFDASDVVSLETWDKYVTPKWWLRYGRGVASVRELTGLSDRDERAMLRAADRYDLPMDLDDTDTRVLTIHASKGTEAESVVLYDGITGRIEDSMRESDHLRENEARTWYVALTRASKRLHLIRGAFDYMTPYLPGDLEPQAAAEAKARGGRSD